MKFICIDGSAINDARGFHEAFGREVALPEYYGYNLDALHDLLTDAGEPVGVIVFNCERVQKALGKSWAGFLRLMRDVEAELPGSFLAYDAKSADPVFKRVSVRKFKSDPVPDTLIETLLRAAMAAPSAGNQQPWEFFAVTDPEKIRELAACSPYASCAAGAPLVVVPCYRTEGLRFPEYDVIDLSNATQNLLLEAAQQGLGAVWLAVAPDQARMRNVAAALGTAPGLRPFALVPVGYAAEDKTQPDRFDPARVHYIK